MRVGLLVGAVEYWLAGQAGVDERVHSSVSNFRLDADISMQVSQRVRAPAVQLADRLNLQTSLGFGTTRIFASTDLAELWSLDYDSAFPRAGTLILESQIPGGGVTRRYMAGAIVSPPSREVTGVSVMLAYRVTGGAITSAAP